LKGREFVSSARSASPREAKTSRFAVLTSDLWHLSQNDRVLIPDL